jgi:hypothetical protein
MVKKILSRLEQTYGPNHQMQVVDRQQYELTLQELSNQLKIPITTLYSWLRKGELKARRGKTTLGRDVWLVYSDAAEIKRLQTIKTEPRRQKQYGWLNGGIKIEGTKI